MNNNTIIQKERNETKVFYYKFEDLKVGMWVWDKKYKVTNKIEKVYKFGIQKAIRFLYLNETTQLGKTIEYEENRFFPVELMKINGHYVNIELFQKALKDINEVKVMFNKFKNMKGKKIQFDDVIEFAECELGSFPSNDFISDDEYFVDFNYGSIAGTLLKDPAHELILQDSFDVWNDDGYIYFEGMKEEQINKKIEELTLLTQ